MPHAYFLAVVVLAMTSRHVTGQQCATAFQTLMTECVKSSNVNEKEFFWFVSNGTSPNGQPPADPTSFQTKICPTEQAIGSCVFSQAGNLLNSTVCQGQTTIAARVESLFQTFNAKCAHPCRFSLLTDLRKCYATNSLNPDLFLSNRSRGHVIGSDTTEVQNFCSKKEALLNCMKPLANDCPETIAILQQVAFDLQSYEKGITILCNYPDIYLKGLMCYERAPPAVEACTQRHAQSFLQLLTQAQQQNWTQDRFLEASCTTTIRQIDCDLTAWDDSTHEACTDPVIGLRRELECSLMPPTCASLVKQAYDSTCSPDKFHGDKRGEAGSNPQGSNAGRLSESKLILSFILLLLPALFLTLA